MFPCFVIFIKVARECYHGQSSDLTASQFPSFPSSSFLRASGTEGRDAKGRNPLAPPRASSCLVLVRGNKRHFTTPLLVSPREMTFEKRAQYWWRVTTQIWVVLLTGNVFVSLTGWSKFTMRLDQKKKIFFSVSLSVNAFSTKVLIGDTIFTSPTGDETAILRGHPSHAKVQPFVEQRQYLHFSVILRPWVLIRSRESNSRPPALPWSALPTELVLSRLINQKYYPDLGSSPVLNSQTSFHGKTSGSFVNFGCFSRLRARSLERMIGTI